MQEFLKYYQAEQKITVILTSHYMKDVEALCRRAVIINQGEIKHDGPLADIVERFSRNKVISLQFSGTEIPADLAEYGNVFDVQPPKVKLAVPREKIAEVLGSVLARYPVEDVGVQERPLEEVIAEFFTQPQEEASGSNGRKPAVELAPADR